ncbi:MAG: lipopolysaccharide kinase InaA family protein [Prevotella sp.]|nr:lipopolysaccharide kinase InaA family protein [Prevotella sp.]
MQIKTIINPDCKCCRSFAEELPGKFADGELIYSGRNEIRRFHVGDKTVVVKRFGRMDIIKKIIYTFFRKNKAIRSYRNSMELLRRDVETPLPIAYVETRRCGLLDQLYYVSAETKARDLESEVMDKKTFDHAILSAYGSFVASLHRRGILHRDLNRTNALFYKDGEGKYHFELIDVNRMTFYDCHVPKKECMENLTLFGPLTPIYKEILKCYAMAEKWTTEDIQQAIDIKKRHDARWRLRKRITHPFRKMQY